MSFWDNTETPQGGTFESGGGDFEPIPTGTEVLAAPDEVIWKEYEGVRYISLKWSILQPETYKNRIVFQKLYPLDNKPNHTAPAEKGAKDRAMLAAIDQNASGGKLMSLGREPTDMDFAAHVVAHPMMLKLQVWSMDVDGQKKEGNWISKVAPKGSTTAQPAPPTPSGDVDNNIPF